MALKDLWNAFAGKTQAEQQNDAGNTSIVDTLFSAIRAADINLDKYSRIPLSGIAALGPVFGRLPEAVRSIVKIASPRKGAGERLYVAVNPKAIAGILDGNSQGITGNIMQYNGQGKRVIAGRMRFQEVGPNIPGVSAIPFDPVTLAIAAALIRIEKKLDDLQKAAEEILQFLKLEKQSRQRGNLNMLSEILQEYKQNPQNEKMCALRNVEVQTIKRDAHHDILFYQERIARELNAQQAIHVDSAAQKMLDSISDEFFEYQLACYLYAFSTNLDLMLQKCLDAKTLDAAAQRLDDCSLRYSQLYNDCHKQIANYQDTTLEKQLVDGLGIVAKSLGNAIGRLPVLRDGQVDEMLINAGNALKENTTLQAQKKLEKFAPLADSRIEPFAQNVRTLNLSYNHDKGMLTDGEALYVLQQTE